MTGQLVTARFVKTLRKIEWTIEVEKTKLI